MNKSVGSIFLLFVACWFFSASSQAQDSSACALSHQDVAKEINQDGPKLALDALYGNYSKTWEALLNCISTGETSWLKIAVSLRVVSDAGTSEGLDIAVGKALIRQPERVLRITAGSFERWNYCGMLDNDDPAYASDTGAAKWLNSQESALNSVHDLKLKKYVDKCRVQIKSVNNGS